MPTSPQSGRTGTVLALLLVMSLSGCQKTDEAVATTPPADVSRPAEILEISGAVLDAGLRFPGRVRAVQRAELAFNVPGQLVELPVQEGQRLAAGELIARLDPTNFEVRLAAAQAEFEKARTDYDRVRKIWEKSKAVSQSEVDQKRTAMEVARSSLAAARKERDDTRLTAPFAGLLARRYVENYQNVQAKEVIVSLQDVNELEIVIHVPERVIRNEPRRGAAYAVFEGLPERRFPVTLKGFAAEADPQTQTYEVVLGLTRPADVTLLPGMSVEVYPEAATTAAADSVLIPLKAVLAGPDGVPAVWVVNPEDGQVSRRPLTVGPVQGDRVVVLSGLQVGERIVTAGVHHLRDGLRVRPLNGS